MTNKLHTLTLLTLGLTFAQCQDNLETFPLQSEDSRYDLYLEKPQFDTTQSRTTTHADGTVEWNKHDQLLCYVYESGKEMIYGEGPWKQYAYRFNIDQKDYKAGHFVLDTEYTIDGNRRNSLQLENNTSYNWYVVNPFMEHKDAKGISYIDVLIDPIQLQEYANPTGHIGALDLVTGVARNVSSDSEPTIQTIHHKTLMKVTVVNEEPTPITLQHLKMTAEDASISSQNNYQNFQFSMDGSLILRAYSQSGNFCTVKLQNAKSIAPNASYDFYMIVPQFKMASGKEITFEIKSDKGVLTQTKKMKKDMNFKAGCINTATIHASGFEPETDLTNFDANFMAYLTDPQGGNFDQDADGKISKSEAKAVKEIYIHNMDESDITSVSGIEYLTELEYLTLEGGSEAQKGKLTELDLTENTKLKAIQCNNNALTTLTLGNMTELTRLECENNALRSIDLSKLPKLSHLNLAKNQLSSLNTDKNTELGELNCSNNTIGQLNLTENTKMNSLECFNCGLTTLDLTTLTELYHLKCSNNSLTSLDLKNSQYISNIKCDNNQLTSITLPTGETQVNVLSCSNNQLTSLDISGCSQISVLHIDGNEGLQKVIVFDGFKAENIYDLKKDEGTIFEIKPDDSPEVIFADENFKKYLLNMTDPVIDTNGDGKITEAEAARPDYAILLQGEAVKTITSVSGIEKFTRIQAFTVNTPWGECYESPITSIDLTQSHVMMVMIFCTPELSSLKLGRKNINQLMLKSEMEGPSGMVGRPNTALKTLDLSQCTIEEHSNILIEGFDGLTHIYVAPGTNKEIFRGIDPAIITEKK